MKSDAPIDDSSTYVFEDDEEMRLATEYGIWKKVIEVNSLEDYTRIFMILVI